VNAAELLDLTRAHLDGCALCFDLSECEALALLHTESQFNARVRFRLLIDNTETLFYPVCDRAWHVRYAFPTGKGHFITAHYIGNPAGSIRTFEQAVAYARACLLSANEDLIDYMRGCRPVVAHAGPPLSIPLT
jgi:hypothetical protein